MRFHYAESMTPISNLLPLAQAAEAHGYSGFTIADSLMYIAREPCSIIRAEECTSQGAH